MDTYAHASVCVAIVVGWVVSWVAKAVVVMMIGQHTQHILHAYIHTLFYIYTQYCVYIHTYIVNIYIPHDVYTNNGCGVICGCDIGWG